MECAIVAAAVDDLGIGFCDNQNRRACSGAAVSGVYSLLYRRVGDWRAHSFFAPSASLANQHDAMAVVGFCGHYIDGLALLFYIFCGTANYIGHDGDFNDHRAFGCDCSWPFFHR